MPKNHPAVTDGLPPVNLPPGDPHVHVEQAKPGDPTTVAGPTGPQSPAERRADDERRAAAEEERRRGAPAPDNEQHLDPPRPKRNR